LGKGFHDSVFPFLSSFLFSLLFFVFLGVVKLAFDLVFSL